MSAGTLTLTNNSDAVTGAGTLFTSELVAGDFIVATVGGVTYTLPVKTINSDTDLKLARNYNGPGISGIAWTAMPRDTLNRISAQMAADTAYIIGQRVLEVENWYQLLEVNGNVTIKMADGSSYTGPSWLKLIDVMKEMKIDELIPIAEQIRADAQQVADDKPVIVQAKDDAEAAATAAAASEENAATSESNAATSASTASTKADEAAESARQAAASNPALALQKSLNLSDLDDKEEAWLNVRPDGPTSLSADPVEDMDSATMGWVKKFVASVKSVIQSWSVINADATAPANGTTVKGGALRSAYKVGSTEQAAAELLASLTTSSTGVKTVSAEVVVKDSTSGTTTSKTIKLGTIDGLIGGIISSSTSIGGTTSVVQHNSFVSDGRTYHQGGKTYGYLSDSTSSPGTRYWALWNEYVEGGAGYIQLLFNIGSLQKYWTFYDSGNAAASGTWNSNSDGRLKIRVKRVEDPLVKMRVMQGATWDRLDGAPSGQGFIAQEVERVFPDAVSVTGDRKLEDGTLITGVKSVDVAGVAAALHHESILQLMDIVKEAIATIAGVTTDESAKAALEALAERIPAPDTQ